MRWEETALDVKAAVEFARRQPGITRVVLFALESSSGIVMTPSFIDVQTSNGSNVVGSYQLSIQFDSDVQFSNVGVGFQILGSVQNACGQPECLRCYYEWNV